MTITEDRDFGRLVFSERLTTSGVIYLRYRPDRRSSLLETLLALLKEEGDRLLISFVVLRPGRSRIDRLPPP